MAGKMLVNTTVTAGKAEPELLDKQIRAFRDDRFVRKMLDAMPSLLAVLNAHRQIIYANTSLIEMLEAEDEDGLLGLRPGDVFDCVHVYDSDDGCGAGELCRSCGALAAIAAGERRVEVCRMTRLRESLIQAHELQVTATPFDFGDETYTIFSVEDKSADHRRQMLERIFFHDIMNVVGSIRGFSELLEMNEIQDPGKLYQQIREAAEQVISEVEAQRMLSDAEHGRLELKQEISSSLDVLQRLVRLYEKNEASKLRRIKIAETAANLYFLTDQGLLLRILGNMVMNALEAIETRQTVTLDCREKEGNVCFSVHNPGLIPQRVQPEIFRRTYSTKGPGRGLGTYSMRLLSNLLDSDVDFTSTTEHGTIFSLCLPTKIPT